MNNRLSNKQEENDAHKKRIDLQQIDKIRALVDPERSGDVAEKAAIFVELVRPYLMSDFRNNSVEDIENKVRAELKAFDETGKYPCFGHLDGYVSCLGSCSKLLNLKRTKD